jgi:hypothetical protein
VPNRFPSDRLDGRWIAAAFFLAFAAALKLVSLAAGRPIFELPPFSWFGPMPPYFADLRGVVSWSDQYVADPSRPGVLSDPWNRPMNYPHPWLYLHDLGVNGGNVMAAGCVLGLLFLAAALYVLGPLDAFGGVVAGSFLTSYALMFGLERANVDLLMFALLAVALALRRWAPAAAGVIGAAAILKIHPLFAFGAMVRPPWRQSLVWIGVGLVLFVAVTCLHAHEFLAGLGTGPNLRTGDHSFGVAALGLQLFPGARRPDLYAIVLASGITAFIFVVGLAAYVRPAVELRPEDERPLFAFRIGAGIYLGSYLLGTNHDYRAACLVFCLPLLLRLFRRGATAGWPFATLLLLLVSVNWLALANDGPPLVSIFKQATAWALLFCLAALYASTLPTALQWPRRGGSQNQCGHPVDPSVTST